MQLTIFIFDVSYAWGMGKGHEKGSWAGVMSSRGLEPRSWAGVTGRGLVMSRGSRVGGLWVGGHQQALQAAALSWATGNAQ